MVLPLTFQHVSWDHLNDVNFKANSSSAVVVDNTPRLGLACLSKTLFHRRCLTHCVDHLLPDWQLTAALFPYAHFSCNSAYSSPHRCQISWCALLSSVGDYFLVRKIHDSVYQCKRNASNMNIKVDYVESCETPVGKFNRPSQSKGTQADQV